MKKLLSFLTAGALALGLIGCSNDLHDFVPHAVDLSAGGVAGGMQGWSVGDIYWDSAEDNIYTYQFTASASEIEWKIVTTAGDWNSGAYAGDAEVLSIAYPLTDAVELTFDNCTGGGSNAKFTGLEEGATYTVTFEATGEGTVKVTKLESSTAKAAPVPYYLDGYFLTGHFGVKDQGSWAFTANGLIWGAKVDAKTGEVTYTKDFKATVDPATLSNGIEYALCYSDYSNKTGAPITVGNTEWSEPFGNDQSKISGLEFGKSYRMEIKTNPDKEVVAKVYPLAETTISFKVKGLVEGEKAWMNGTFWGSSWPQGWPLASYNSGDAAKAAEALANHNNAVADSNGEAVFDSDWNVKVSGAVGDKLSYNFKAVASKDNWATDYLNSSDLTCEITLAAGSNYIVVVDAADSCKVTVETAQK